MNCESTVSEAAAGKCLELPECLTFIRSCLWRHEKVVFVGERKHAMSMVFRARLCFKISRRLFSTFVESAATHGILGDTRACSFGSNRVSRKAWPRFFLNSRRMTFLTAVAVQLPSSLMVFTFSNSEHEVLYAWAYPAFAAAERQFPGVLIQFEACFSYTKSKWEVRCRRYSLDS